MDSMKCNHPLGLSENLHVNCLREKGHAGEHSPNPRNQTMSDKLEQAMLDAELTEQRKALLDDPANTLFGIPMTAVKRLIDEKRAEDGDDWWVLERPRAEVTEQRGGTSAKEWLKEHLQHNTIRSVGEWLKADAKSHWWCLDEIMEAYASSRLAEVTQQYTEKVDQCISLSDRDYWKNKADDAESRLAEVSTQSRTTLSDEYERTMFAQFDATAHALALDDRLGATDREAILWGLRRLDKFYRDAKGEMR
jgi:hypothetical protein